MKIEKGKTYTFEHLEKYLIDHEEKGMQFLKVQNVEHGNKAMMFVFFENFCGNWRSGDGVLFYDDGETHSASDYDKFKVLEISSLE